MVLRGFVLDRWISLRCLTWRRFDFILRKRFKSVRGGPGSGADMVYGKTGRYWKLELWVTFAPISLDSICHFSRRVIFQPQELSAVGGGATIVSRRKKGRGSSVIGNGSVGEGTVSDGTSGVSAPGYEQLRDQRVRENMKRMQKLGIIELSLKLKSAAAARKRFTENSSDKEPPSGLSSVEPSRRSSRLKTLTPVSYAELRPKTKKTTSKSNEIHIKEGSEPEVYREEDVKLLGDCGSSWTLCVDGYGQDGKRLYDPINGESCHQCRQKTVCRHTHCSKCNLVQGQLCGDCLYMRYGENVMEVNMNPEWICPVCRGICNCSSCRQSKGWAPTGALYRKVLNLGFKSVAHYLIQTRCAQTNQQGSSTEHLGAVDSSQALPNTGLEINTHDDSLTSFDIPDFEGKMEEA